MTKRTKKKTDLSIDFHRFCTSLQMSMVTDANGHSLGFPRLIFNSQAKQIFVHLSNRSTISRDPLGLCFRGMVSESRDQVGRIFSRVPEGFVSHETARGSPREHRNYCRRWCNNIQPIVSGRVASTRDLLFARQDR